MCTCSKHIGLDQEKFPFEKGHGLHLNKLHCACFVTKNKISFDKKILKLSMYFPSTKDIVHLSISTPALEVKNFNLQFW